MKIIEGIIVDLFQKRKFEGRILYDETIVKIEECRVSSNQIILPGFVDAHIHIESSMLTPYQYSRVALKHGVIASVSDPHEITNVCGFDGLNYMIKSAEKTPMKIATGIPSCVPATLFETSGATITSKDVEKLLLSEKFTHLSEMMNFPGVLYQDAEVLEKISLAKKYNKPIDGHAPALRGEDLKKYINAGITTDHECKTLQEAQEKLDLGMKVLLRQSSASKDFENLLPLIDNNSDKIMFCTDDCHPDDLLKGYINLLVKKALDQGYSLFNVLNAASKNPVEHYRLPVGLLREGDSADFIVIDNLSDFSVINTTINGQTVWDGVSLLIDNLKEEPVNNFFSNEIFIEDLQIERTGSEINVIEVIPDSLLTKRAVLKLSDEVFINPKFNEDILKIVVLNRYQQAKPAVGFIKGFGIKRGALASSVAHDSHNIIAVGVDDLSIANAIRNVQQVKGGIVVVVDDYEYVLPLPVAGLMSNSDCETIASLYLQLVEVTRSLGCSLKSPFMTMAFMALLVIPELKIGDKGLFDISIFDFVNLQND